MDKVCCHHAEIEKAKKISREKPSLYWLLGFTGLRIRETLGMTVDDMDPGNRLITIAENEHRSVAD